MREARTRGTSTRAETPMRTTRASSRGMGAFQKIASGKGGIFRVEKDTRLIGFLEEENFASANRHWIEIIDSETGKKRLTVKICIKGIDGVDKRPELPDGKTDMGCPLCKVGDSPKATAYFNVVDLTDPSEPLVWEATTDPFNKIARRYDLREKNGQHLNDPDIYWAISKEKNGANDKGVTVYSVDPVKERDLAEDWPSVTPLTDSDRGRLVELMATEEGYIKYPDFEHLVTVVGQLAG
jgi:hypothetical protein